MIQPLMIGTTELIVIGGAILLFFGGKKIPELMRSLGQGVKTFKEGMNQSDESEKNETIENSDNAREAENADEK